MGKRKIALYGISANPITTGHELVAKAVYAQCLDIEEVWISPCYHHQFDKELADEFHRLRMCEEVTSSLGRGFRCWDWEMKQKFKGTTWDFAQLAEHQFPEYEFHFVIGTDNAYDLKKKWAHGEELIQKMPFIVVQRGVKIPTIRGNYWWEDNPPHREISMHWPISSTDIRNAIQNGNWRSAQRNVHPKVWEIIYNNGLYGCYDNSGQHGYGR